MNDEMELKRQCSFCGKQRRHVKDLIKSGPIACICNECVEVCRAIIKKGFSRTSLYTSDFDTDTATAVD